MSHLTLPIIRIEGQNFYQNHDRFIARGVVYQTRYRRRSTVVAKVLQDPLDDERINQVLRDVEKFKDLHINALWVYNYDPSKTHDECMKVLAENGIYVIFEASNPAVAIKRSDPKGSYSEELLSHYSKVIDSVARYRNTLGVCLANQVINELNVDTCHNLEDVWDVFGRLVRDMKQYMRFRNHDTGQRILPLCISDGQWSSLNTLTYQYVAGYGMRSRPVGGRVDFYCFIHYGTSNDPYYYSNPWLPPAQQDNKEVKPCSCHPETYNGQPVSWDAHLPIGKFENTTQQVPVLISEYGDNTNRPRTFDEVWILYRMSMTSTLLNTLSGGFVYEFYEGGNKYGLVKERPGGEAQELPDYHNLRARMRQVLGLDEVNDGVLLLEADEAETTV